MINVNQFRKFIVIPAISLLQLYSKDAEELLVFTCAAESEGGTFIKQVGGGPALGVFQMEPATYNDIWQNFLRNQSTLHHMMGINFDAFRIPNEGRMVYDMLFACAMARLHYRRVKAALPKADDIDAIWAYYKQYYNTPLGKAEKDKAIAAYLRFIKPEEPKKKIQPINTKRRQVLDELTRQETSQTHHQHSDAQNKSST